MITLQIDNAELEQQLRAQGWQPPNTRERQLIEQLTPILRHTLLMTAKGYNTNDLAEFDQVTTRAIDARRSRLLIELDAETMYEAIVIATKAGLL